MPKPNNLDCPKCGKTTAFAPDIIKGWERCECGLKVKLETILWQAIQEGMNKHRVGKNRIEATERILELIEDLKPKFLSENRM